VKRYPFLFFLFCLLFSVSSAQDTTTAAKIDTILQYQRATLELQKEMHREIQYVEPLINKSVGIELNLARMLWSSAGDFFTVSGTFSVFSFHRSSELAFPFFYQNGSTTTRQMLEDTERDIPLTLVNVDAAWRYFIGRYQEGFYFSVGTRYTYIRGVEGYDFYFTSIDKGGPVSTAKKVGAYFGIGYRYFTHSGFYWGVSLSFGRYFSNDTRDFLEVFGDDSKTILDVEILKVGFAF
jgi:hypothetical protein